MEKRMTLKNYELCTLERANHYGLSEIDYDLNIPTLVFAGYLIGSWFGGLDYAPMKKWEITTEGRQALKNYKLQQLIASTTQCAEGACKGEYGSECYLRTDCVTCGRPIIREKKGGS